MEFPRLGDAHWGESLLASLRSLDKRVNWLYVISALHSVALILLAIAVILHD